MTDIREARSEDLEQVYRLIAELELVEPDREAFAAVFNRNLGRRDICYGVAVKDCRAVGFVSLHIQELLHHNGSIGEIQELIVTGECRGTGTGRRLMDWACGRAGRQGCLQLEVCCNRARPESHAFYERMGMDRSHYKFCKKLVGGRDGDQGVPV